MLRQGVDHTTVVHPLHLRGDTDPRAADVGALFSMQGERTRMMLMVNITDDMLFDEVLELLGPGMFDGRVMSMHNVAPKDVPLLRPDKFRTSKRSEDV